MKHITSKDNPQYKELVKLAGTARHRAKLAQTLLDGAHLLSAYLASGKQPLQLIVTVAALHDVEISALIKQLPDVPVVLLDDTLFAGLSELKSPSGILTLISIPQAETNSSAGNFALLLEDIQDPGNLGSIMRSAAAAGCDNVFMSKGCADAWSPKVLRAAMGGHFVLQLNENSDLLSVAEKFSGKLYAATLSATTSLYSCDLRGNFAFAIGNEGAGLSANLLAQAIAFTIPMPGRMESLNAAAAAAICVFEAVRQRNVLN
jgi:TrmH family RNA methyltransferase